MASELAGEKTVAFSIAQEILSTSVKIPTIPDNGIKIMEIARMPEDQIDIPDFVKLVESDPGLLMQILQLSNSFYYSEMDRIVSLRAAITRIGLVETVNTVCLYFFQKILPKFPDIQGFSYNDFWSYSWVCAVANRRLGHPELGMDLLPGDLYMAGMLHGLGKLLLAVHFPNEFSQCVQKAGKFNQPLCQLEKDVFGTMDGLVASRILQVWKLPAVVSEGVAYYAFPELAPPEYRLAAGLTQFACAIAEKSGIGSNGENIRMEPSDTFLGRRSNSKLANPEIQEALVREIVNSVKAKSGHAPTETSGARVSRRQPPRSADRSGKTGSKQPGRSGKGLLGWVRSVWKKD